MAVYSDKDVDRNRLQRYLGGKQQKSAIRHLSGSVAARLWEVRLQILVVGGVARLAVRCLYESHCELLLARLGSPRGPPVEPTSTMLLSGRFSLPVIGPSECFHHHISHRKGQQYDLKLSSWALISPSVPISLAHSIRIPTQLLTSCLTQYSNVDKDVFAATHLRRHLTFARQTKFNLPFFVQFLVIRSICRV